MRGVEEGLRGEGVDAVAVDSEAGIVVEGVGTVEVGVGVVFRWTVKGMQLDRWDSMGALCACDQWNVTRKAWMIRAEDIRVAMPRDTGLAGWLALCGYKIKTRHIEH